MQRQPSAPSLSLVQRIALAAVLLCLALGQSLSFAHRALHHDVRMLAFAHEEAHASAHEEQAKAGAECEHAHGLWNRLFAGHEHGDESCRLLDASNTFLDQNQPPALVFPALSAHVLIAYQTGWLSAWQAPLFEARAPPALSL
jgi:hypothetical protein